MCSRPSEGPSIYDSWYWWSRWVGRVVKAWRVRIVLPPSTRCRVLRSCTWEWSALLLQEDKSTTFGLSPRVNIQRMDFWLPQRFTTFWEIVGSTSNLFMPRADTCSVRCRILIGCNLGKFLISFSHTLSQEQWMWLWAIDFLFFVGNPSIWRKKIFCLLHCTIWNRRVGSQLGSCGGQISHIKQILILFLSKSYYFIFQLSNSIKYISTNLNISA